MKGSARVTRAGGRDFEMENSKTDQWWGFKKNRCICLCGTFGRAGKGGQRSRGWWGKVFAGRVFFFWIGMGESCGEGGCWFFFGGS